VLRSPGLLRRQNRHKRKKGDEISHKNYLQDLWSPNRQTEIVSVFEEKKEEGATKRAETGQRRRNRRPLSPATEGFRCGGKRDTISEDRL